MPAKNRFWPLAALVFLGVLLLLPELLPTPLDGGAPPGPPAPAQSPTASGAAALDANLAYADSGNLRQVLDVYRPAGAPGPYPTVLLLHGGGFLGGAKEDLAPLARRLAQQGYAAVLPEYRLAPEHVYPAQVQDAFCVLAWLYANAGHYGFDPDHVVAVGESAGGSLAALLGAIDAAEPYLAGCAHDLSAGWQLQGVVVFYPVVDFTLPAYADFFIPYLGVGREQAPEVWAEASPLHWLDGREPPYLAIHGAWDVRVPSTESRRLVEGLRAHAVEAELVLIPQADHGFIAASLDSAESQAALAAMEAFLARVLREPDAAMP